MSLNLKALGLDVHHDLVDVVLAECAVQCAVEYRRHGLVLEQTELEFLPYVVRVRVRVRFRGLLKQLRL